MLIPVCCERLPVKLELCVVSARGLPVMNRSINCTEAFVEVRFNDTVEKTDVITDLDPVWNSEYFEYDTDEKQLSEELVEFRVMDHDTYTSNDAIGRVDLDCNILVQSLRVAGENCMDQHIVLPIWDTLNGVRGHLMIGIRLTLLVPTDYSYYVKFMSSDFPPDHLQICEVVGLVSSVKAEKDPEHEWLDRIRTPRATNESRQWALRSALREAATEVAEKAHKAGAQMVLGYQEYIDIEGAPSGCYCIRTLGTAVVVVPKTDTLVFNPQLTYPIVTVGSLPLEWYEGCGPMVSSRCIFMFEDNENVEAVRKRHWAELRNEIYQQAYNLGCNAVVGYSEEVRVHDGIVIFGCMGTAVRYGPSDTEADTDIYNTQPKHEKEKRDLCCVPYHAAFDPAKMPFSIKLYPCTWCKMELCADMIMSTAPCPPTQLLHGNKNYVQVSLAKRLTSDADERDEVAAELSNLLPAVDRDLFNLLIVEGKAVNAQANAMFEIRHTTCIADGFFVCVLTAVLVRLNILQREELTTPSIPAVLSFSSLQRHNDSRRFSWGSVREAIRLKPAQAPTISVKVLHLKRSAIESMDDDSKFRSRLHTFVGRIKRRQHEKEYLSHIVLERQLSTSIGVIEGGVANNANTVAGLHLAPPLVSLVLNREQAAGSKHISRWRQLYIKEDNSGLVRDSSSIDTFMGVCLEDCLGLSRGSLSTCCGASFTNFAVPSSHLTVSRDQAQLLLLISADLTTNT